MGRPSHYSPVLRPETVRLLYHERVRRGIPMTRLADEILIAALKSTDSSRVMEAPQNTTKGDGE